MKHLLPPAERRFYLSAGVMLAVSGPLCVAWGMAQKGGMYHFNGYFYYALYYFGLLLALGLLARHLPRWWSTPASVLACVAAATSAAISFHAPRLTAGEAAAEIRRGVVNALQADRDPRPKLLVFEHKHWDKAAAVALELKRRGVEFYIPTWWAFMFQRRHDISRVAGSPDDAASVWWISLAQAGGFAIGTKLGIHVAPAPLRPNRSRIVFGEQGNAFRYVQFGFKPGEPDHATTNVRRAVLRFAPAPTRCDVRVTFDAEADEAAEGDAAAEVFFNGEPIGRVVVGPRTRASVRTTAAEWNRRREATLELYFPDAKPHRSLRRPDYEWWSGWRLWSIAFESR